jgi:hypothetical protein
MLFPQGKNCGAWMTGEIRPRADRQAGSIRYYL